MQSAAGNELAIDELLINESARSEEIEKQLHALSSRDLQLWSIGILVMVVLSAGFLSLVFPYLSPRPEINLAARMLPQFFFGLITLIVLFNIYVLSQKKTINATRRDLIRELLFNQRTERMSLIDPVTRLSNRRGLDRTLAQEVAFANRLATKLTILIMRVDSLQDVTNRHGVEAGDRMIAETVKLLRNNCRASDIVGRYSGREFLVIMPGTAEPQAEFAVKRLNDAAARWNLSSRTGWQINYLFGLAAHVTGCDAGDLLRAAERKLLPVREKLVPVFDPLDQGIDGSSHLMV